MHDGQRKVVNEGVDNHRFDLFWKFVHERQEIWLRRHIKSQSPPWTEDSVLRRYRFTNVYRILDPGTQYVVEEILDSPHPRPDRLFNCIIYRILGRRETHSALGVLELPSFTPSGFEHRLREIKNEKDHAVFTGAYTVAPYHQLGGRDKIENVSLLAERISKYIDRLIVDLEDTRDLREAYQALRDVPGLGRFLAFQVAVDLTYPLTSNGGRAFIPHSPDEWAVAGPGARRGLAILKKDKGLENLDVMTMMHDNQIQEFERRGLNFSFLEDQNGDRMLLSVADIQNCLCEFSKYCRINENPARARRRFREELAADSAFHVNDIGGWTPG